MLACCLLVTQGTWTTGVDSVSSKLSESSVIIEYMFDKRRVWRIHLADARRVPYATEMMVTR